jgi:hypothetical protein
MRLPLIFVMLVAAVPVAAQSRWQSIGTTNIGNPVELDTRSVKRAKGIVTATLRSRFVKPARSPQGPITSARTVVSFDCAKHTVAIVENTYFLDEKTNKVYQHTKVGVPGYTPPMGGSLPEVGMAYVCKRP